MSFGRGQGSATQSGSDRRSSVNLAWVSFGRESTLYFEIWSGVIPLCLLFKIYIEDGSKTRYRYSYSLFAPCLLLETENELSGKMLIHLFLENPILSVMRLHSTGVRDIKMLLSR
jgi:hypothetical protein